MKFPKWLSFGFILNLAAFAGSAFLVLQMLLVCTDVVSRYLLNSPIPGAAEITEFSMLYITFLGAAWVLKREGHVNVDMVITRLKVKTQKRLTFATSVICAILFFVLTWYGLLVTIDFLQKGVVTPTILELPRGLIIGIIPIGSFLLAIQFIRRAKGAIGI